MIDLQSYDDLDLKIMLGEQQVNILYLRSEPAVTGWNVENHCHSGYELHVIPEGRGTLWIHNTRLDIRKGDVYLTGPDVYHEQRTDVRDPMAEYCLCFEFVKRRRHVGQLPPEGDGAHRILRAFTENRAWLVHDGEALEGLFRQVFQELREQRAGYYSFVRSLVLQILILAGRSQTGEMIPAGNPPEKRSEDRRRFLIDFQFAEFYRNLTFSGLAGAAGISGRQLHRVLREYYGMTFSMKLLDTRLNVAYGLLLNSDRSVTAIAEETGFRSLSYFYRMIRQRYGCTPAEIRETQRQAPEQV